jgi:hypothetical protein
MSPPSADHESPRDAARTVTFTDTAASSGGGTDRVASSEILLNDFVASPEM